MDIFSLFIIDDDQTIVDGVLFALEGQYRITAFGNAEDALDALSKNQPDLILLDIGLPGMDGIQALREIKGKYPDILVIMITAFEEVKPVIAAMKMGAHDYVVKPLHIETLEINIENALSSIRLRKEIQSLQESSLHECVPCFIGESREFRSIMEFVKKVAKSTDTPVLILGETGTGKELIAQTIHYRSPNFKNRLVTVNCASIPNGLIESELFGYEKGAFTGASSSGKKGLIEEAAGGTLFLDEVGDMNLDTQAKLLRFLESGEYFRVGGTRSCKAKTRVISATNRNLMQMIDDGTFREDLFYRLGVIKVELPSLQDRREDIISLSKFFLIDFNRKFKKEIRGISPEAEEALRNHPWHGNIRELKNIVERGILISEGPELTLEDLGLTGSRRNRRLSDPERPASLPPEGVNLTELLEGIERDYIEKALARANGNESQAARFLSLNHHTFRYRRKKLMKN
ncbi:MAG: sigma-54 dependent transcriptional regulator [Proteobacteria bacterium]|nr:sigma-54 dependent transcriptional regulator [Pseudomonadota bacterium]MBU1738880.1 sigma-54 dependent transcriptional regulator [Pseudomonadota bacterium]